VYQLTWFRLHTSASRGPSHTAQVSAPPLLRPIVGHRWNANTEAFRQITSYSLGWPSISLFSGPNCPQTRDLATENCSPKSKFTTTPLPLRSMVMTVHMPKVKGKGQSVQKWKTDGQNRLDCNTFPADAVGLNFKDFYRKSKRNDRRNGANLTCYILRKLWGKHRIGSCRSLHTICWALSCVNKSL